MDFLTSSPDTVLWLVIMILFMVLEAFTLNLVSIWFAAGALAGMVMSYFGAEALSCIITFVMVSFILILITRPIVHKYLNSRTTSTNVDDLIGRTAITTEDTNEMHGQVKIPRRGVWLARSDEYILEGTEVEIVGIKGATLMVQRRKKDDISDITDSDNNSPDSDEHQSGSADTGVHN